MITPYTYPKQLEAICQQTTGNPRVQALLQEAAANFSLYVEATEVGLKAKRNIPTNTRIDFIKGNVTNHFRLGSLSLDGSLYLTGSLENPFTPGCGALIQQSCSRANCEVFSEEVQGNPMKIATVWTIKAIKKGGKLLINWAGFFVGEKEADEIQKRSPIYSKHKCQCARKCENFYLLNKSTADPWEAYTNAYARHQAGQARGDGEAPAEEIRGDGGAPAEEIRGDGDAEDAAEDAAEDEAGDSSSGTAGDSSTGAARGSSSGAARGSSSGAARGSSTGAAGDSSTGAARDTAGSELATGTARSRRVAQQNPAEPLLSEIDGVYNPIRALNHFEANVLNSFVRAVNCEFKRNLAVLREVQSNPYNLERYKTDTLGYGVRNGGGRIIPPDTLIMFVYSNLNPVKAETDDDYAFNIKVTGRLCVYDKPADDTLCHINLMFANHKCTASKPNCKAVSVSQGKIMSSGMYIALQTVAPIRPGEQIFFDYGSKYWTPMAKLLQQELEENQEIRRCLCAEPCPNDVGRVFKKEAQ
jgi:hypothetical protein